MLRTRRRRGLALAAALSGSLVASGCASIPDQGSVHAVASDRQDLNKPYIYNPGGPSPGSTPEKIASDFLVAMRAQPVSSETAREFLTDRASREWDPGRETIVFSGVSAEPSGGNRVDLTLETTATLGPRGAYTPENGAARTVELTMKKVGDEWRIDDLPDAFLVSQTTFQGNYQPVSLYFINRARSAAVPEPVYLPGGDQLATNAVNSLLRGPTEELAPVATTYIPEDTALDVSVRVRDDGRAEVRLAGSLDDLSKDSRELLSAQIVLTLRQIPGVEAVQILVNGVPYEVPGVDEVQDVDAWRRYDTSVSSVSTPLLAMRDDRLIVLQDGEVQPYAQSTAEEPDEVGDFAVDAGLERIATVNENRTNAFVGRIDESSRRTALVGKGLLAPQWDSLGWLWLTEARTESTSIAVSTEQQTRSIPIGALAGMHLRSMSISPDGARFAAVATEVGSKNPDQDAAVYVGQIRRAEDGIRPVEVTGVRAVSLGASGLHSLTSIAWRDATNLVVLAKQGTLNTQPYIVSIDGSSISGGIEVGQPSLPDIGANSVVASGRISDPIYIGDDDGGVWQLDSNQRWSSISETKVWTPHFPG